MGGSEVLPGIADTVGRKLLKSLILDLRNRHSRVQTGQKKPQEASILQPVKLAAAEQVRKSG